MNFAFFGTPELAVTSLEELKKKNLIPSLIVTAPDKPAGRGLLMTPPPVKTWADKNKIPIVQPENLQTLNLEPTTYNLQHWDAFVVVAYGKIIPERVLKIPKRGTLNLHPSILPHHRGPSPIESQILSDDPNDIGVSIMLLDEEMDHGPIIAQTKVTPENWPIRASELREILSQEGGVLLAYVLPEWVSGKTKSFEQSHKDATYCKKISKEDGLIDIEHGDPYQNYLKILAYDIWPRAYFLTKNKKRVIVTDASLKNGKLELKKVIPEGKKEMPYDVFLKQS